MSVARTFAVRCRSGFAAATGPVLGLVCDARPPPPRKTARNGQTARRPSQLTRCYTIAIARGVPRTFPRALSMQQPPYDSGGDDDDAATATTSSDDVISYDTAVRQQDQYISTLRSVVPTLLLDPSESHPDCPFVEDTAVVVKKRAVVTLPGAPSRRGEVHAIKGALLSLGVEVIDMADDRESSSGGATCDGGDVLLPVGYRAPGGGKRGNRGENVYAKHMFIGISSRTNDAGYRALKRAFENNGDDSLEVVPVPLSGGTALHLKSIVTHVDERTLLAPKNAPPGSAGSEVLAAMRPAERGYDVVFLPDANACNVVSCNGVVIAPPTACPETRRILERVVVEERGWELVFEDASEFAKCDGALTCQNMLLDL